MCKISLPHPFDGHSFLFTVTPSPPLCIISLFLKKKITPLPFLGGPNILLPPYTHKWAKDGDGSVHYALCSAKIAILPAIGFLYFLRHSSEVYSKQIKGIHPQVEGPGPSYFPENLPRK